VPFFYSRSAQHQFLLQTRLKTVGINIKVGRLQVMARKKSDDHHGHQCHDKMSAVDLNKDSKISKEEFMKHHEAMFDKKDANKDGFMDESEMHKHDGSYASA
jgi:hypothetical protein